MADASDLLRTLFVATESELSATTPGADPLIDVVFAHQSAPRPKGPYGLITPLGAVDLGESDQPCFRAVMVGGVERIAERRSRTVQHGFRVDVYATGAVAVAGRLAAALRSSRAGVALHPFALRRIGPVKGDAAMIQSAWEDRANFSIELAVLQREEILIDVIEHVSATIDAEGAVGATHTDTLTVP